MRHKLREEMLKEGRLYRIAECGMKGGNSQYEFFWRNVTCEECIRLRKSKWHKLLGKMK